MAYHFVAVPTKKARVLESMRSEQQPDKAEPANDGELSKLCLYMC